MEKIPEERFNRGRPESSISTGRPWSGSKGVQAEAYSLEPIAEPPGIERETRQRSMSQPQQRDSGEERTPTLTDSCIQAFMRVFPCCPLSPSASNEADDPASGPAEVSISRAGDEPTEPGANERSSYRSSSPPLSRGRG